jgi:hypothetical protein
MYMFLFDCYILPATGLEPATYCFIGKYSTNTLNIYSTIDSIQYHSLYYLYTVKNIYLKICVEPLKFCNN